MKNILLRADANIDIGIGHVMRCIALGQMLRKNGYKIHFLTKTNSNNILKRIINENFILELIEYHEYLEGDAIKTKNYAKGNNITWVITDGYIFNTFYQEIIKDSNLKLCCIDDIAVYHYVSDIIIKII